jgi:Leucine-rich repeat (LRR) protein
MNADALDSYVEVKNEHMPTLKACALDSAFRKLTHLNLSLIKEIPPRLLAKCPKLQLLDLSLNHISRIQNLPTTLTELSLAQNRLTVIEGLS